MAAQNANKKDIFIGSFIGFNVETVIYNKNFGRLKLKLEKKFILSKFLKSSV